jgi:hypothetical protein
MISFMTFLQRCEKREEDEVRQAITLSGIFRSFEI